MRWPRRDTLIPLALGALAFVVAFVQRPGLEVAETKVDLHVAPGSFLRDVLSAWTPSGSLGHVFAGQYGGYLWPMGPFFALGHALGLPDWVVGRLWIGAALALSAWGMVRLLDALAGRPRGAGHLAGGLLYMLNPYVVTYVGRTSITLLATAALPWLLLCVHRGLRDPRGWWWPAAFALVLTSTGGGVNVAVTAWLLLAPALLVVYELGWGAVQSARGARVRGAARAGGGGRLRCGGSRPCSSTRATAWTSCPTPSSRGRSGARPRCPSRCGCWASGRATSASATRARCAPSRPTPASIWGSHRSWWRRWPSRRCASGRSRGRGARATRRSSSRSSSSACW